MEIRQLFENNQEDEIANLQPDSVISVYHGTSLKDSVKFAWQGIDGRMRTHRLYPHFIGVGSQRQMVNRGLFVTANINTALSFGRTVVEFLARGEDLYYQFPSPDSIRKARQWTQKKYPNSFRPEVSYHLLEPSTEPQALFRGLVPTKDVIQFHSSDYDKQGKYHQPMRNKVVEVFSREEYKDWYENVYIPQNTKPGKYVSNPLSPDDLMAEPNERITFRELVARLMAHYSDRYKNSSLTPEEIMKIIKDHLDGQQTYQQQIGQLENIAKIGYSTAKFILPDALKTLGVKPAPNTTEVEQYWS
jgi:hypothetical protein